MSIKREHLVIAGVGVVALAAPWFFSNFLATLALLWLMVLFALTWDINGGQMGYNSFGNVFFFGLGVYACALVQRDSGLGYFPALFLGMGCGGLVALLAALLLGPFMLGLRGHYFAIGTLALGLAGGEIAAGWGFVGAASGMDVPIFPGSSDFRGHFYYYLLFALAAITFFVLRWLYGTRFGLAINAIRDNEDKAEAMGLQTTVYKTAAWCVAAVFLGVAGGPVGNLVGIITPHDLAFAVATYGVWMVLMPILGGRGTIWGPIIGAVIFHLTQEFFWIYLLGWQRVAMGLLIVLIVVFFPQGILGWINERRRQAAYNKASTATRNNTTGNTSG